MDTHLIQQSDRRCGRVFHSSGSGLLYGVRIQLDLIGNCGKQGRGNAEGHLFRSLIQNLKLAIGAGGDRLGDLNGHIHHVGGVVGLLAGGAAQKQVALIGKCRAGRSGICAGFIPEAHIIAVSIAVPADVVAVFASCLVIAKLTGRICLAEQFPDLCRVSDVQTTAQSPDHIIAQGSGVFCCAEGIGMQSMGQNLAGIQPSCIVLAIDEDALDILDLHAAADLIHKGNIAAHIGILTVQSGNHITGLQADLINNALESCGQIRGLRRIEIAVYICALVLNRSIKGNIDRTVSAAQGYRHSISAGKAVVSCPKVGNILLGRTGRIQHSLSNIAVGYIIHTQAEGIEIGRGIVSGSKLFLNIGCCQLGDKTVTGGAGAACAVTGIVRNIIKLVCGIGGSAVTHQYNDRRTGTADRYRLKGFPCSPQTTLNISTASQAHTVIHILIGAVLQIDGFGLGVLTLSRSLSRSLVPALIPVPILRPPVRTGVATVSAAFNSSLRSGGANIIVCQLDIFHHAAIGNGGVVIQRHQHMGLVGIQHHANPVGVGSAVQKLMNGFIGGVDHGPQLRCAHTAGNIQHKHRIGRGCALAYQYAVGCQRGKRHKEIVCANVQAGNIRKGSGNVAGFQHGLIRPDTTGVFGGNIHRIERGFPCVQGAGIRFHSGGQDARYIRACSRDCKQCHSRKQGYDQHQAQRHGNNTHG